jgi:hypothetical protein
VKPVPSAITGVILPRSTDACVLGSQGVWRGGAVNFAAPLG